MKIKQQSNGVVLIDPPDFNIYHIFDCGQCFRWNPTGENEYTGTAFGHNLKIQQNFKDNIVILSDTTIDEFNKIWYNYFDMGTDYSEIKSALSQNDPIMRQAAASGGGIRILRQDAWETIVSFIISASNNIPRIKLIIERLCEAFGDRREASDGRVYYTFPTAERLAALGVGDLACIKAGFRDKYIIDAARRAADGRLDIDALFDMDSLSARETLKTVSGIGNKVADCVTLFGLHKADAFPVDVWIKRIVEHCYFGGEDAPIKVIQQFASDKFATLGGYAQQYLFYYARENKIAVK